MILFHLCRKINIYILKTLSFLMGGGQDKLAWTAYPPGVKIIRVGGKISREILPPPGGKLSRGGKINCYTGKVVAAIFVPDCFRFSLSVSALENDDECRKQNFSIPLIPSVKVKMTNIFVLVWL